MHHDSSERADQSGEMPDLDDLENLEHVVRTSDLNWLFEWLEDRYLEAGHHGKYDVYAARTLWEWGMRPKILRTNNGGIMVLDLNLVTRGRFEWINNLKQSLFIINPYTRAAKRRRV